MSNKPSDSQKTMKTFWDSKAKENAAFYIATWRGYAKRDLDDFFLSDDEITQFIPQAYCQSSPSKRMLEIGCGIGRMTRGFARAFGEVHAIDVSGEMIRQAHEQLADVKNVHLLETNGSDLQLFKDNFFDFCFSYIVFQHIPDKTIIYNYIREASRVLKQDGVFYFQVNGLPNPDAQTPAPIMAVKSFYRRYIRRVGLQLWDRLKGGPGGFTSPSWVGTTLSLAEITQVCAKHGLKILEISGVDTQYMWITAQKSS